jgi:uncharacterized protein (DUF1499 family)
MPRWLRVLLVAGAGLTLIAVVGVRLLLAQVEPPALGVDDGELAPCPDADSCVSSTSVDPRHAIEPLACDGEELDRVVEVAEAELPRTELLAREAGYAHLLARSLVFGFPDDLELLAGDEVVHVRSASRVGENDLGVNRDRVERLRSELVSVCGGVPAS